MKKILFLTEKRSLELAKQVVTATTSYEQVIGTIVVLNSQQDAPEQTFNLQLIDRQIIGNTPQDRNIGHLWAIYTATYKLGAEVLLLPHIMKQIDRYDLVVAVDSGLAEAALIGKDPDAKYKVVVVRGVPKSLSSYSLRQPKLNQVIMDSLYKADSNRVNRVIVPTASDRATLANKTGGDVIIESADFPVFATDRQDRDTIRRNIALPDKKTTLTPEDTVIMVHLPTMEEAGLVQPDVVGMLEMMYTVAEKAGENNAPKWLLLLGSHTYRDILKGSYLPAKIRDNLLTMGKKDELNMYFDERAVVTFMSAVDIVVDVGRDYSYNIMLETAKSWGLPVLSSKYGNVQVKTVGTELFGNRLDIDDAANVIHRISRGDGYKVIPTTPRPILLGQQIIKALED
jgi:hypothetical protein